MLFQFSFDIMPYKTPQFEQPGKYNHDKIQAAGWKPTTGNWA